VIPYRYLPSAREELNEAAAFYEARVPGLGEVFLDDVDRAIETIRERPRIGAPAGRRFRKILLHRFPFSLIYAEPGEELLLVAVAHQRKRPGYWRGRQ
jgi:plasmid stabilization system protein ParE